MTFAQMGTVKLTWKIGAESTKISRQRAKTRVYAFGTAVGRYTEPTFI